MAKLKIYALPSINKSITLHANLIKPTTNLEFSLLFVTFVIRKWRFQVSDLFASYWHRLYTPDQNSIYSKLNRWSTRKSMTEYLLARIPSKTSEIQIIIPTSISILDVQTQIKSALVHPWSYSMFAWLPVDYYFCAYGIGYPFLFYHTFRCNNLIRAKLGQQKLKTMIDIEKVEWIHSAEFDKQIKDTCSKIGMDAVNGDLDDDVIDDLAGQLKLPDLKQTYRRARMEHYIHDPKPVETNTHSI